MMTEQELEAAIEIIMQRLDEVNTFYLKKIAAQIKSIGTLSASSINRLSIMLEMGADIAAINEKLAEATALNIRDLLTIYAAVEQSVYTDPAFSRLVAATAAQSAGIIPAVATVTPRLRRYTQLVGLQTGGALQNLSNTTVVSQAYQSAVDQAIFAASTGVGDYNSLMRRTVENLGYSGMQVYYPSGYHRRLDTAVRQNIVDGVKQISQKGSDLMGEALGTDAFEISAHANSAPDHEPVQGRVLLREQFDRMQSGLPFTDTDGRTYAGFKRPIGEWNCMHMAMAFSTQWSKRRYTSEQLDRWAEGNKRGCEIDGKHYSTYQARQLQRRIETEIRRQKDVAVAAQAAGDDELRKTAQRRIDALVVEYGRVCASSGLRGQRERMTVNGFKPIKL